MNLSLGFSPCPNDTFIFYGLVSGNIQSDIDYSFVIEDVEALNQKALNTELAISKLSFHTIGKILDKYQILNSGAALGKNCGPLVISKKKNFTPGEVANLKVAIPGYNTTAHLLFMMAFPKATRKIECLYSEIEDLILRDQVDLGLIIHESRFTYESKGLTKVLDLGEYWEQKSGQPIPLGAIAIQSKLPQKIKQTVDRDICASLEFAYQNEEEVLPYCRKYAQEMDENVMRSHIRMYVNEFSTDLGEAGRSSVLRLFDEMKQQSLIQSKLRQIFV